MSAAGGSKAASMSCSPSQKSQFKKAKKRKKKKLKLKELKRSDANLPLDQPNTNISLSRGKKDKVVPSEGDGNISLSKGKKDKASDGNTSLSRGEIEKVNGGKSKAPRQALSKPVGESGGVITGKEIVSPDRESTQPNDSTETANATDAPDNHGLVLELGRTGSGKSVMTRSGDSSDETSAAATTNSTYTEDNTADATSQTIYSTNATTPSTLSPSNNQPHAERKDRAYPLDNTTTTTTTTTCTTSGNISPTTTAVSDPAQIVESIRVAGSGSVKQDDSTQDTRRSSTTQDRRGMERDLSNPGDSSTATGSVFVGDGEENMSITSSESWEKTPALQRKASVADEGTGTSLSPPTTVYGSYSSEPSMTSEAGLFSEPV